MTEFGVVIVLIAMFVWLFLKENSRRGVRSVRAYTFMKALEDGHDVASANREAAALDGQKLPQRAIHDTMVYLNAHHRGRQRDLFKAAEKAGWKN